MWVNVYFTWKEKLVVGLALAPQIFFAVWNVWSVCYFSLNGHYISAICSVAQAIGAIVWCIMINKYRLYEE